MTKGIVNAYTEVDTAQGLGMSLLNAVGCYSGHILYVELPDGRLVTSFDVEEETLSDGSKVYNIILRAS
jgi:hypothetical protein